MHDATIETKKRKLLARRNENYVPDLDVISGELGLLFWDLVGTTS
jgi:hypothetical protein